ncbi:MAG: penicillin-binding transpeptidase domain-containing protein [Pseudomonadota bacterium]
MKRAAEKKQDMARRFRQRSIVVVALFAVFGLSLLGKSVWLLTIANERYEAKAESLHLRERDIFAHRGIITDRHGEPLAISTPVDSIWAVPHELALDVEKFGPLATALDMSPEGVMRRINKRMDKQFVWLRRHLRPDQVRAVNELQLRGIDVMREYKRFYPTGEVAAHLVGFANIDEKGQTGIEKAYEAALTGESGRKRIVQDREGRAIADVESIRTPRPGRDIALSIDSRIQYFAYRELKRAVKLHQAQTGSMVIIDVRTGEVLAMVNQPGFNPNDGSQRIGERVTNRAMTRILDPGSSIKPLVAAIAMSEGVVSASELIDTSPGVLQVGAKPITDKNNLGAIDLSTIIARSSNVGMSMIALRMDAEQMWRGLNRLGFGLPSTGTLHDESAGKLNHYMDWSEITQATSSYGYGLSVTPLQLASAYATLGNDGARVPVSLLRVDDVPDSEQVFPVDVARRVLEMMEHVVKPGGTGTKAAIPGYRVAGKTGTSWKWVNGEYTRDKYYSVFAGVVPVDNPRLAAVIIIDEPKKGDYYGGDVAAPVFSEVMREALRLMALPPDNVPGLVDPQPLVAQQ